VDTLSEIIPKNGGNGPIMTPGAEKTKAAVYEPAKLLPSVQPVQLPIGQG